MYTGSRRKLNLITKPQYNTYCPHFSSQVAVEVPDGAIRLSRQLTVKCELYGQ